MRNSVVGFVRWMASARLGALVLLASLLALRLAEPAPLETLRLKTWDVFQQAAPRVPQQFTVRIVDIDEASLKALGQWPWPRTVVADLVTKLAAMGAVVVGFDAVFPEIDRTSPAALADAVPSLDADTRARLKALPSNELALAAAMRRTRVVVGHAADPNAATTPATETGPRTSVATLGPDPRPWLVAYPRIIPNRPEIEAAALGRGLFAVLPDRDGIVRKLPAIAVADDRIVVNLVTDVLRVATGAETVLVRSDASGVRSLVIAGIEIPTDRNGQIWPRLSRYDPRRAVSAVDVLSGKVDATAMRGKLVLVGSSAAGLFDVRATPLDRTLPGVAINADALESMIERRLLTRPSTLLLWELIATVVASLGLIALLPRLGARRVMAFGAGVLFLLGWGAWMLFKHHGLLADATFPALATFLTFGWLAGGNYLREEQRRTELRGAFGRYVSPEVVDEILRRPEALKLGGETREVTVLFSDVRGFSGIAERYKADPQGLTRLMNRILTPMSNAIVERRGTVDKYIGDAVMAFWNAPHDVEDHAGEAAYAVLDMLDRIDALNVIRRQRAEARGRDFEPIVIGIGLATGTCTVGNMGSDLRFDYSVLGDSVNLASRLEVLTKSYALSNLIGASTAERIAGRLDVLAVDRIRVKGKTLPEDVFTILPPKGVDVEGFRAALSDMRAAFMAQDWSRTRASIAQCRKQDPTGQFTGLLDIYDTRVTRCLDGQVLPPDWDGVWTMADKENAA